MRRFALLFGLVLLASCGVAVPSGSPVRQSGQALAAGNDRGLNDRGLNDRGLNDRGLNDRGLNDRGLNDRGLNDRGLNDRGLNDRGLNDRGLNDRGLNDRLLAATLVNVELSPIVLADGTPLTAAALDGTAFSASTSTRSYAASDFAGAYLVGHAGDGRPVVLRIDSVTPAASSSDLTLYMVSWYDADRHATWRPICTDASGNAAPATAVANYWDYSEGTATGGSKIYDASKFTFACQEGAIYKCLAWGFHPWETVNTASGPVSLDAYHQACTRMTRADYCGDGVSHTIDGSWINFYDDLGITTDTDNWVFEAQWTAAGATCISPTGVDRRDRSMSCFDRLASPSCGSAPAMLSSETPTGRRSPSLPGGN